MTNPLKFLALAAVAVAIPAAAHAQDTKNAAPQTRADALVDHNFTVPTEGIRVFLAGGVTYRAEFQGKGITLQIRPIGATVQEPLIQPWLAGTGAGQTAMYTIKPRQDAVYQLNAVQGAVNTPVNLTLTVQKKKP